MRVESKVALRCSAYGMVAGLAGAILAVSARVRRTSNVAGEKRGWDLACAMAEEFGMRAKTFFLLVGILFIGEILAVVLPGHHPPATPKEADELNVTIRGWVMPTKEHVRTMPR